ncbi:hypothetical protein DER44DRAFT_858322, partial [Fusarium oxysporum]
YLAGFIYLICRYVESNLSVFIIRLKKALLQPPPVMRQEIFFFEGESAIQIIWSGLSDLCGAGWCA